MPTNEAPWASIPGPSADAGRVHVLLHQDLRVEVGDLRAGDDQRVAALRFAARDQQRVRRAGREAGEEAAGAWPAALSFSVPRSGRATPLRLPRRLVREALARAPSPAPRRPRRRGSPRTRAAPLRLPKRASSASASCENSQLLAAALAEDPAHQRGGGDDVGGLERLRHAPDRGVLAGQLGRVELGLEDVLVDAGEVVLGVARRSASPCGPRYFGRSATWRSRSASV